MEMSACSKIFPGGWQNVCCCETGELAVESILLQKPIEKKWKKEKDITNSGNKQIELGPGLQEDVPNSTQNAVGHVIGDKIAISTIHATNMVMNIMIIPGQALQCPTTNIVFSSNMCVLTSRMLIGGKEFWAIKVATAKACILKVFGGQKLKR